MRARARASVRGIVPPRLCYFSGLFYHFYTFYTHFIHISTYISIYMQFFSCFGRPSPMWCKILRPFFCFCGPLFLIVSNSIKRRSPARGDSHSRQRATARQGHRRVDRGAHTDTTRDREAVTVPGRLCRDGTTDHWARVCGRVSVPRLRVPVAAVEAVALCRTLTNAVL